jgi:quinol monooxygenase YgiN
MTLADGPKVGLVINGTFRIHPDDAAAFAEIVRPHVIETAKSPGCRYYTLAIDVNDETVFHILEGWADRDSFDAHNRSPAFQATLRDVGARVRMLARDATLYTIADQAFVPLPDAH